VKFHESWTWRGKLVFYALQLIAIAILLFLLYMLASIVAYGRNALADDDIRARVKPECLIASDGGR
jgi:hypothetical protein